MVVMVLEKDEELAGVLCRYYHCVQLLILLCVYQLVIGTNILSEFMQTTLRISF